MVSQIIIVGIVLYIKEKLSTQKLIKIDLKIEEEKEGNKDAKGSEDNKNTMLEKETKRDSPTDKYLDDIQRIKGKIRGFGESFSSTKIYQYVSLLLSLTN